LPTYDPAKAKKLLAEAGYPNGFDGGDYNADVSYANLAEAVINNFEAVGIHVKLRPLERAAFDKSYSEKSLKNIIQSGSAAFGSAATRLETYVVKGGAYVYGSYADLDEAFREQDTELDPKKRDDLLQKMQQVVYERSMFAHLWQLGFINGAGPRVKESGLGLIPGHAYSAPYEDVAIIGQ